METVSIRSIGQQINIWQDLAGHLTKSPGQWFNFAQQAKYRVGRVSKEEREISSQDLSSVPTLYFHFSHLPLEAWRFYIQALSLSSGLYIRYDFLFDIFQNTINSVLNHDLQTEVKGYNPIIRLDFSRYNSDSLSADEAIRSGKRFAGFEVLACLCQSTSLIHEVAQNGLELTSLRVGHRQEYVPVIFLRDNRIIVKAMPTDKYLGYRRAIIV